MSLYIRMLQVKGNDVNSKLKESEQYHSTGSLMDRSPLSLKTDRDHLLKDNLGRYCPKTFRKAKGKTERWFYWEMNLGLSAVISLRFFLTHNTHTATITYPRKGSDL